jgi:hypothetical protein
MPAGEDLSYAAIGPGATRMRQHWTERASGWLEASVEIGAVVLVRKGRLAHTFWWSPGVASFTFQDLWGSDGCLPFRSGGA